MNKKIVLAVSIFISSFTLNIDSITAQDAGFRRLVQQDLTTEQKVTKQLQRLTKALSLTANQESQITPLLLELNQKRDGMRDDSDKRAAMREMRDLITAQNEKMKTILSADQFSKYEDIKNDAKETMRGKKGRRNQ